MFATSTIPSRDPQPVEPERSGQRVHGRLGRAEIELEVAREPELRGQPAEHRVRVGHGRLGPSALVTGRAGIGAGAVRADPQDAGGVDAGDAPSARADRTRIHHRQRDRDAPLELLAVGVGRLTAGQEARLEARSAHVRGDQVSEPDELAQLTDRP